MTRIGWRRSGCLRAFHPRPDSAVRLACFPHAGGSANTFLPLSAALPDSVEVVAVQYPGRQERRADAATDLPAVAEEAARDLCALDERPLALFGHSLGALVAFETARLLGGRKPVVRLFASAAWPPSWDWQEPDLDTYGDDKVVAELQRLDGVPAPVLHDDELLAETLRIVRADSRLIRGYRAPADAVLTSPITAMLGDADPKNDVEQVSGWARHTSAGLTVEVFPGGHFYLTDPQAGTARRLAETIT